MEKKCRRFCFISFQWISTSSTIIHFPTRRFRLLFLVIWWSSIKCERSDPEPSRRWEKGNRSNLATNEHSSTSTLNGVVHSSPGTRQTFLVSHHHSVDGIHSSFHCCHRHIITISKGSSVNSFLRWKEKWNTSDFLLRSVGALESRARGKSFVTSENNKQQQ